MKKVFIAITATLLLFMKSVAFAELVTAKLLVGPVVTKKRPVETMATILNGENKGCFIAGSARHLENQKIELTFNVLACNQSIEQAIEGQPVVISGKSGSPKNETLALINANIALLNKLKQNIGGNSEIEDMIQGLVLAKDGYLFAEKDTVFKIRVKKI